MSFDDFKMLVVILMNRCQTIFFPYIVYHKHSVHDSAFLFDKNSEMNDTEWEMESPDTLDIEKKKKIGWGSLCVK